MWKIPFTFFIILSAVICGLLFWQWDAYSKEMDQPVDRELASQKISIHTESDKLVITQKLSGLTGKKEIPFALPSGVTIWQCLLEDGRKCEKQEESVTSIKPDNKGNIQIQFTLPIKPNEKAFLFNQWLASFSNVDVTDTKVELTDSTKRNGTWAMGIPLIGNKKLDLIDYYVFEGQLANPSLYWQADSLVQEEVDSKLMIYSEQEGNLGQTFTSIQQISNRSHLTVVITNQLQEGNGNGIIITRPDIKPEMLEKKLLYSLLKLKFDNLPIEQSWLVDLHVSLLLNSQSQISKSNQVIQELKLKLTEEELESYLQTFLSEGNVYTPQKLDEILVKVMGKPTMFFEDNKNEDSNLVPLYFLEKRNISLKGKIQKDLHIIYMGDQKLFPFVETLSSLGFQVKVLSDNETLLLTKGLNSYRFYVNQNIFIYNEEDYGLLENPLTKLNETIYINYQWLTSLFNIQIDEDENTVYLKESTE
ncbi:copper amine oxidase N-terminal domain-containing protein [Robertmurraya korlensis]|uniref:copper amine oxidase N-terminal domain-containing protein n=1 Tax=Robertmurraya korlensis TaxID=519977 RepID=UPI00203AC321|nr:copper amine oxidase N-terminal domain-containing protein [Robertmurraya korlensis]MCM3600308.1 copper amine oxidase N-terminal domain-containing protein [Robertmurraya korlensis]